MVKRAREASVEFDVMDGFVIIKHYGKKYAWHPPKNITLNKFLTDSTFEYSVVHNSQGKAMINVEDLRKSKDVLRQEINPLQYKDIDSWVADE
jgi:hypothetical protein